MTERPAGVPGVASCSTVAFIVLVLAMTRTGFTVPREERYFEDYVAGSVHEFGPVSLDEDEIVDFGKRFVPQPYHIDPELAKKTIYKGLIASGWHTAAAMMRVYSDNYLSAGGQPRIAGGGRAALEQARAAGRPADGAGHGAGDPPVEFEAGPRNRQLVPRNPESGRRSGHEHEDDQLHDRPAGCPHSIPGGGRSAAGLAAQTERGGALNYDIEINSAAHYPAADVVGLVERAEQAGFGAFWKVRVQQHRPHGADLGGGQPHQHHQAGNGHLPHLRPQPGDAGVAGGDPPGPLRRAHAAGGGGCQQGHRRVARRRLRPPVAARPGVHGHRAQGGGRGAGRVRGRGLRHRQALSALVEAAASADAHLSGRTGAADDAARGQDFGRRVHQHGHPREDPRDRRTDPGGGPIRGDEARSTSSARCAYPSMRIARWRAPSSARR